MVQSTQPHVQQIRLENGAPVKYGSIAPCCFHTSASPAFERMRTGSTRQSRLSPHSRHAAAWIDSAPSSDPSGEKSTAYHSAYPHARQKTTSYRPSPSGSAPSSCCWSYATTISTSRPPKPCSSIGQIRQKRTPWHFGQHNRSRTRAIVATCESIR